MLAGESEIYLIQPVCQKLINPPTTMPTNNKNSEQTIIFYVYVAARLSPTVLVVYAFWQPEFGVKFVSANCSKKKKSILISRIAFIAFLAAAVTYTHTLLARDFEPHMNILCVRLPDSAILYVHKSPFVSQNIKICCHSVCLHLV
jgi:hypothetical protein